MSAGEGGTCSFLGSIASDADPVSKSELREGVRTRPPSALTIERATGGKAGTG